MSWHAKVIQKHLKEMFSSIWLYVIIFLLLAVWNLALGKTFEWIWIEPIEVPPFERLLYSALTFATLGRLAYVIGFYKVLWEIFKVLFDWQSYKEAKVVIWAILMWFTYSWFIPKVIDLLNWVISVGYNLFKLILYLAPPVGIAVLIGLTTLYIRSLRRRPTILNASNEKMLK